MIRAFLLSLFYILQSVYIMFYATYIFLFPLVSLQKDVDFESPEAKKQVRGSTSTKRSHAAEVHNLSERVRVCTYITLMSPSILCCFSHFQKVSYCISLQRRRDRINEKMKALQELIPRCNKVRTTELLNFLVPFLF